MLGAKRDNGGDNERPAGEDEAVSWAERLLVATSIVFTLLLFVYVILQGMMTPVTTEPKATVTATETLPSGDIKVTVTFRNPQDVGIVMATVGVDCDTPPPELTFEHIPADDRQEGYVVCPPGTENPSATVSAWTEA